MAKHLPAGWRIVYPDDIVSGERSIVSGPFGSNIGKRFFVESGVPVIRGNNLTLGDKRFIDEGFVFLTEEKAKQFKNCQAIAGDIVFTAAGTLGQVGLIPKNAKFPVYIISNKQLRLRPDPHIALPDYLYYWFSSKEVRNYIIGLNTGSSVPLITLGKLRSVSINLPPIPTQRKIATILSAYDDLIENNLRRIKILEEMAQNLYREWFVKFRFPGYKQVRLIDSPLGRIPEGWEVSTLGDCCELVMGQSPKSEFYNKSCEGLPFHQGVTDFGDRFPTDRIYCTITERIAEKDDILLSVRAPVGRINIALHRLVIGRGIAAIRARDRKQFFLLHQLKEIFCEEDSMGNGAIFKAVTKSDLMGVKLVKPASQILAEFDDRAHNFGLQIKALTAKNTTLRFTRDLLLPRLISGEVDVSELDITVPEEAA